MVLSELEKCGHVGLSVHEQVHPAPSVWCQVRTTRCLYSMVKISMWRIGKHPRLQQQSHCCLLFCLTMATVWRQSSVTTKSCLAGGLDWNTYPETADLCLTQDYVGCRNPNTKEKVLPPARVWVLARLGSARRTHADSGCAVCPGSWPQLCPSTQRISSQPCLSSGLVPRRCLWVDRKKPALEKSRVCAASVCGV